MRKLKFKTFSNTEVDAKNYDLAIRKSLFGGHTFVLKDGNEMKYLKMESVRSILTGKNETVLTDMTDSHIVGIVEDAFDENNIHNRSFVSEIESDRQSKPPVVPVEPNPSETEPDGPTKPSVTPVEPDPSETELEPVIPPEDENVPETSDEFTYEPTPGKISKIFLHLYDGNTLENFTPSDSQTAAVDGSYCYIDSDGVTRCEFNVDKWRYLKKIGDSTFDIVVAFDVNVLSESYLDDIIHTIISDETAHMKIYEKMEQDKRDNNAYYSYTENYSDGSSIAIPIESVEDVTKLMNILANTVRDNCRWRKDNIYGSIREYEPSGFHVMGSDKVVSTSDLSVDYFDIFNTSATLDMYSTNIASKLNMTEPNESVGFQGIYVVDKAIQQGRALDIGFDISTPLWMPIRSVNK